MNSSERIHAANKTQLWIWSNLYVVVIVQVKISYKHMDAEMIRGWLWLFWDIFKVFALNHTGPLVSKEIIDTT